MGSHGGYRRVTSLVHFQYFRYFRQVEGHSNVHAHLYEAYGTAFWRHDGEHVITYSVKGSNVRASKVFVLVVGILTTSVGSAPGTLKIK